MVQEEHTTCTKQMSGHDVIHSFWNCYCQCQCTTDLAYAFGTQAFRTMTIAGPDGQHQSPVASFLGKYSCVRGWALALVMEVRGGCERLPDLEAVRVGVHEGEHWDIQSVSQPPEEQTACTTITAQGVSRGN
ncbi:hypothetical protein HaLaN_03833 [Haematococcus lacustris]|uniref:Uncharacterized protein n=1 Tax=Haematococcus lacustris TaxID=44745 RepID=A0A699YPF2_HAELA|nr:hypothetical protein HaLaN_03833 [Haematococcus lacustris]